MGGSASKGEEAVTVPAGLPYSLWSNLPPELAGLVIQRLPSYADRARFGSVCRHWRYAAKLLQQAPLPPSQQPLPWLNFLNGTFRSLPEGEEHNLRPDKPLVQVQWFRLSANKGWVLFKEGLSGPAHRHYLKNPLSGAVIRLPGHCKAPIILPHGDDHDDSSNVPPSSSDSEEFNIWKVIVCTSDVIAAKISYHRLPDVVACCRSGSRAWSTGPCNGTWYEDMALYKGKIFTVCRNGGLFSHELMQVRRTGEPYVEPPVEQIVMAPPPEPDKPYANLWGATKCYLVVSSRGDKLLMLRWTIPCEHHCLTTEMAFKVFQADLEMARWVHVESLDDEALFVSTHCSKAISASSHAGQGRGDQIYFADYSLRSVKRTGCITRTCGVYDMRSKVVSPISSKWPINDTSKASWFFPSVEYG
jgi:hypothetical protein